MSCGLFFQSYHCTFHEKLVRCSEFSSFPYGNGMILDTNAVVLVGQVGFCIGYCSQMFTSLSHTTIHYCPDHGEFVHHSTRIKDARVVSELM
mmetsp:Transcript_46280/g.93414  ORF Transcript_46280/g.93414 Transcript_46280/m.93414 type:complete len:92 (+) Transcript_46280:452-727(+)